MIDALVRGVAARHDPLCGNHEMTLPPMKSRHVTMNFLFQLNTSKTRGTGFAENQAIGWGERSLAMELSLARPRKHCDELKNNCNVRRS